MSHGQPRITETADTGSADTAAHLYYNYKHAVGATISSHSIHTTTLHRSKITVRKHSKVHVSRSAFIIHTLLITFKLKTIHLQSRSRLRHQFSVLAYTLHKRPPPICILGPTNPVHIPTSHLPEIHPNIIHPSMPRPPQWSLSLRLPHQDPIHPPLFTHTCHMPCPSHSS